MWCTLNTWSSAWKAAWGHPEVSRPLVPAACCVREGGRVFCVGVPFTVWRGLRCFDLQTQMPPSLSFFFFFFHPAIVPRKLSRRLVSAVANPQRNKGTRRSKRVIPLGGPPLQGDPVEIDCTTFFPSCASVALARSSHNVVLMNELSYVPLWKSKVECGPLHSPKSCQAKDNKERQKQHFFSVLRLCCSCQVVAHCCADERIN